MSTEELEARLRACLAARAGDAPAGELVAERIIDDAFELRPVRVVHRPRGPRWRAWALPLIAAGSVAAIVGALAGVSATRHSAAPAQPGVSGSPSPSNARADVPPVVPPPSGHAPTNPVGLAHFRVLDLSFVGADTGWALGTATCIRDASQRCAGLAHTSDGSRWVGVTGGHSTPFNVPGIGSCSAPCVTHIRFANAQVGYAYGLSAFFTTTDGGLHWTSEVGGADALETLADNVIRLVDDHRGCPGPCNLRAEVSAIGSTTWTPVPLPGGVIDAASVSLARTGRDVFIRTSLGQPGSLYAVSLFTSTDAGTSWTKQPDPCRTDGTAAAGVPVVGQDLTSAEDGSVNLLCVGVGGFPKVVLTSTDGGLSFVPARVRDAAILASGLGPIAAVSATVLVGYAGDGLYRSANAGATWTRVVTASTNGPVSAPGFESASVGRWVAPGGTTVWTTHDAGLSWTPVTFG